MTNAPDILLIEDNEDDAELALKALNSYHCIHLKDGSEGLDFVFAKGRYESRNIKLQPRLIILDIKLPKLDGIDVLKEIKQQPETKTLPVVMLSSSSQPTDIEACYSLGANSYVVKPGSFKDFIQIVKLIGDYWLRANRSA